MKSTLKTVLLFYFLCLNLVHAQDDVTFTHSGEIRVRSESKTNADYSDQAPDRLDFTTTRARVNLNVVSKDQWNFFFGPQLTKIWGQNTFEPTSASTNSETQKSGSLSDPTLTVHQAYLNTILSPSWQLTLGRQELNYGDQLLVGGVGWHNTGRSFDLIKTSFALSEKFNLDVFRAKLVDDNISNKGDGDSNFSGLYLMHTCEKIKNLDVYLFDKADHRNFSNENIYTLGTRIKTKIGNGDIRFESSLQKGRIVSNQKFNSEFQADLELGYQISLLETRFSVEYLKASKHFDTLYPTAHKWLGFADQFSRRNIEALAFHATAKPSAKLMTGIDYHMFKRNKEDQPAYNFQGTSLGNTGEKDQIANEIDLSVHYQLYKNLKVSGLYALVTPKSYLKQQNSSQKDSTRYMYLEMSASY